MRRSRVLAALALAASVTTVAVLAAVVDRNEDTTVVGSAADNTSIPPVGELSPEATPEEASARLGGCREIRDMVAPAAEFIAEAERWLEVVQLSIPENPNYREYLSIPATVEKIESGAQRTGQRQDATIRLYGESVPGIEWAHRAGGRAFVALTAEGRKAETAFVTLIQHPGGRFFFAGACQERTVTSPLKSKLGSRFDEVMAKLAGTVGRDEILALLDSTPAPSATPVLPEDRVLNPAITDRAVLDRLDLVSLQLDIPEQWAGSGTVCSRIPAGWNDCLSLASLAQSGNSVTAYIDESRVLDFWLLNERGDPRTPLQRLGRVNLSSFEEELTAPQGTVVRVTLTGTMQRPAGKAPDVADPSARLRDARPFARPTTRATPTATATATFVP